MKTFSNDIAASLKQLICKFETNHKEYVNPNYNETALRVEFLNPLFELLGWDVNNNRGLSIYNREVIHEANVRVDDEDETHSNKKPDYAFRIGGETKFFLEAKKPSVNILENSSPAFQARRYGWNGNHPIVVLSNFEYISVYDCSYRPDHNQDASFARIMCIHYKDLLHHFQELSALISRNSVAKGSLDSIDAGEKAQKEPFDQYFLEEIRSWRAQIASDVFAHNKVQDSSKIDLFTQTLVNRIIFLRVCEDRSFENAESLLEIKTFQELKKLFDEADKKYDSGLFNYLSDAPLNVSDSILIGIFKELYYPYSTYAFNVVQPHIIGQIYEQFLSEHIAIKDGTVTFEQTPECIESNGVVSTPKEIADAIVSNTLDSVSYPCKIADICCGS